jgi:hypothetical protein
MKQGIRENFIQRDKASFMAHNAVCVWCPELETDTTSFESVQFFKYLGSIVTNCNTIEEEIKEN